MHEDYRGRRLRTWWPIKSVSTSQDCKQSLVFFKSCTYHLITIIVRVCGRLPQQRWSLVWIWHGDDERCSTRLSEEEEGESLKMKVARVLSRPCSRCIDYISFDACICEGGMRWKSFDDLHSFKLWWIGSITSIDTLAEASQFKSSSLGSHGPSGLFGSSVDVRWKLVLEEVQVKDD